MHTIIAVIRGWTKGRVTHRTHIHKVTAPLFSDERERERSAKFFDSDFATSHFAIFTRVDIVNSVSVVGFTSPNYTHVDFSSP